MKRKAGNTASKTASKLKGFPKSPVRFAEQTVGSVSITHRREKSFALVSFREALMIGRRQQKIELDEPITIHELREDGAVWMTDLPIELRQMHEAINALSPRGNVLIGGLGLGVAAQIAARRRNVAHVDVVEIHPDVVALVGPSLPSKCSVINADINAFVAGLDEWSYDCAFIDVWRGDNEGTWWEEVFPLRRLIAGKFGEEAIRRTLFWAEDIMVGQICRSLITKEVQHWYYRMDDLPMSPRDAVWFVRSVGLPEWEERYGKYYPKEKPDEES